MLIMFLVVLGVFSFRDLGVDLFPKTDPATVYVSFRLPGASPEEVVSQVVMPLEEAISSVSGIDELRAVVSRGRRLSDGHLHSREGHQRGRGRRSREGLRCGP